MVFLVSKRGLKGLESSLTRFGSVVSISSLIHGAARSWRAHRDHVRPRVGEADAVGETVVVQNIHQCPPRTL